MEFMPIISQLYQALQTTQLIADPALWINLSDVWIFKFTLLKVTIKLVPITIMQVLDLSLWLIKL